MSVLGPGKAPDFGAETITENPIAANPFLGIRERGELGEIARHLRDYGCSGPRARPHERKAIFDLVCCRF